MDSAPATSKLSENPEPPRCWQAARLAATLFAIGRLGHDLRGVFSPALLASERLQAHEDPAVRRAAEIMLRAIDRATDTLGETLRQVRGDGPGRAQGVTRLCDAIGRRLDLPAHLAIANAIPPEAVVLADPDTLALALRGVFAHLATHAARAVTLAAACEAHTWTVTVRADVANEAVVAMEATDLAIARDWLRSCGGDLLATDEGLAIVLQAA